MKNSLLFDGNNLAIRTLFAGAVENEKVVPEIWEYMLFNSIYTSMWKFKNVEEVIIAIDDKSWRKHVFPKYKSNRKKGRDESDFDWNNFFEVFNTYLKELKQYIPFKILKVQSTEADDTIGVLVHNCPYKNYIIISADKDYLQLANKAKIYNPLKKKYVTHDNPEQFLQEQCLTGQKKDNVYNIKTPLNQGDDEKWVRFGIKGAQKIIKEGLDDWLDKNNKRKHYNLNRKLLDLNMVPEVLANRILDEYNNYDLADPSRIIEFINNKSWPKYVESISNVEQKLLTLY